MGDGKGEGSPALSPLTGAYLLVILPQTHAKEHLESVIHKLTKGLLSWDADCCHVDLYKELQTITSHRPEGELVKHGERLIQFASENLVTEVLIHPQLNTLVQCLRNLLSSFTRHRHIIHAGYTYSGNGSWILQDGTFSFADFHHMFQEIEVQRVLVAYENTVTMDIHCCQEGDWANVKLTKEPFAKLSRLSINPDDKLSVNDDIKNFSEYLRSYVVSYSLEQLLEPSDVVGNIRFSHPTLYVFPGGQGDAALFGINGFNMLVDGGFSRKTCFWDFTRHLDRLDAALVTRLNNGNIQGISSFLQRKRMNNVYPQIGHFFCNIQDRRHPLSPDGDKDKDQMLINVIDQGQELISSLHHLSLKPQSCYRDSSMSPINLYHKVGHGKLDMYVLSPAKDSREVKDFIARWNANDVKLFATINKKSGEFSFPLPNRVSICALLVWQPANPNDNITRLLFPGSTPQHKILDGLEKIKHLEFLKYPVCSAKSLSPSSSTVGLNVRQNIKLKPHHEKSPQPTVNEAKPAKIAEPVRTTKTDVPDAKIKPHTRTKKIADKSRDEKIKEEKIKEEKTKDDKVKEEKLKDEKPKEENIKDTEEEKLEEYVTEMKDKKDEADNVIENDIVPEKSTDKQEEKPSDVQDMPRQVEIEIIKEVVQDSLETENIISEKKESAKIKEKNLENLIDENKDIKTDIEAKEEIISSTKPKKEVEAVKKPKTDPAKKGDRLTKKKELQEKADKAEKEDKPKRTVAKRPERKSQKPPPKAEEKKTESAKSSPTTPKKTPVPKLMGEPKTRPLKTRPSPSATPAKSTKEENNRKVVEQRAQKIQAKKEEVKKIERKPLTRKAPIESSREIKREKSPVKAVSKAKPKKAPMDKEVKAIAATASALSAQVPPKGKAIKGKKIAENEIKIISDITKDNDVFNGDVSLSKEEDEILIVEKIELELYPEEVPSEEKEAAGEVEAKGEDMNEGLTIELKEGEAEEIKEEVSGIIETAADIVMKAKTPEEAEKAIKEKTADKEIKEKSNEMEQKQQAEESHPDEKFSATVESGATTTAPTLPEDERIPIEDVKDVEGIEEKHVKEETKEKDLQQRPEQLESKPEPAITTFDQKAQILRDIVKTPDEVADLPVHEVADYEAAEQVVRDLIQEDNSRPEEISGDELKFIKDGLEKEDKSKDLKEDFKESPDAMVEVMKKVTEDQELVPITTATAADQDQKDEQVEINEPDDEKNIIEVEVKSPENVEENIENEEKAEIVEKEVVPETVDKAEEEQGKESIVITDSIDVADKEEQIAEPDETKEPDVPPIEKQEITTDSSKLDNIDAAVLTKLEEQLDLESEKAVKTESAIDKKDLMPEEPVKVETIETESAEFITEKEHPSKSPEPTKEKVTEEITSTDEKQTTLETEESKEEKGEEKESPTVASEAISEPTEKTQKEKIDTAIENEMLKQEVIEKADEAIKLDDTGAKQDGVTEILSNETLDEKEQSPKDIEEKTIIPSQEEHTKDSAVVDTEKQPSTPPQEEDNKEELKIEKVSGVESPKEPTNEDKIENKQEVIEEAIEAVESAVSEHERPQDIPIPDSAKEKLEDNDEGIQYIETTSPEKEKDVKESKISPDKMEATLKIDEVKESEIDSTEQITESKVDIDKKVDKELEQTSKDLTEAVQEEEVAVQTLTDVNKAEKAITKEEHTKEISKEKDVSEESKSGLPEKSTLDTTEIEEQEKADTDDIQKEAEIVEEPTEEAAKAQDQSQKVEITQEAVPTVEDKSAQDTDITTEKDIIDDKTEKEEQSNIVIETQDDIEKVEISEKEEIAKQEEVIEKQATTVEVSKKEEPEKEEKEVVEEKATTVQVSKKEETEEEEAVKEEKLAEHTEAAQKEETEQEVEVKEEKISEKVETTQKEEKETEKVEAAKKEEIEKEAEVKEEKTAEKVEITQKEEKEAEKVEAIEKEEMGKDAEVKEEKPAEKVDIAQKEEIEKEAEVKEEKIEEKIEITQKEEKEAEKVEAAQKEEMEKEAEVKEEKLAEKVEAAQKQEIEKEAEVIEEKTEEKVETTKKEEKEAEKAEATQKEETDKEADVKEEKLEENVEAAQKQEIEKEAEVIEEKVESTQKEEKEVEKADAAQKEEIEKEAEVKEEKTEENAEATQKKKTEKEAEVKEEKIEEKVEAFQKEEVENESEVKEEKIAVKVEDAQKEEIDKEAEVKEENIEEKVEAFQKEEIENESEVKEEKITETAEATQNEEIEKQTEVKEKETAKVEATQKEEIEIESKTTEKLPAEIQISLKDDTKKDENLSSLKDSQKEITPKEAEIIEEKIKDKVQESQKEETEKEEEFVEEKIEIVQSSKKEDTVKEAEVKEEKAAEKIEVDQKEENKKETDINEEKSREKAEISPKRETEKVAEVEEEKLTGKPKVNEREETKLDSKDEEEKLKQEAQVSLKAETEKQSDDNEEKLAKNIELSQKEEMNNDGEVADENLRGTQETGVTVKEKADVIEEKLEVSQSVTVESEPAELKQKDDQVSSDKDIKEEVLKDIKEKPSELQEYVKTFEDVPPKQDLPSAKIYKDHIKEATVLDDDEPAEYTSLTDKKAVLDEKTVGGLSKITESDESGLKEKTTSDPTSPPVSVATGEPVCTKEITDETESQELDDEDSIIPEVMSVKLSLGQNGVKIETTTEVQDDLIDSKIKTESAKEGIVGSDSPNKTTAESDNKEEIHSKDAEPITTQEISPGTVTGVKETKENEIILAESSDDKIRGDIPDDLESTAYERQETLDVKDKEDIQDKGKIDDLQKEEKDPSIEKSIPVESVEADKTVTETTDKPSEPSNEDTVEITETVATLQSDTSAERDIATVTSTKGDESQVELLEAVKEELIKPTSEKSDVSSQPTTESNVEVEIKTEEKGVKKELEKEEIVSKEVLVTETSTEHQKEGQKKDEIVETPIEIAKIETQEAVVEDLVTKETSKEVAAKVPHSQMSEEEILKEIEQDIIPLKRSKRSVKTEEIHEKKKVTHHDHQAKIPVEEKFEAVRLPYVKSEADASSDDEEVEQQLAEQITSASVIVEEKSSTSDPKKVADNKESDSKTLVGALIGGIMTTCDKIVSEFLDKDTKETLQSEKDQSTSKDDKVDDKKQLPSDLDDQILDLEKLESEIIVKHDGPLESSQEKTQPDSHKKTSLPKEEVEDDKQLDEGDIKMESQYPTDQLQKEIKELPEILEKEKVISTESSAPTEDLEKEIKTSAEISAEKDLPKTEEEKQKGLSEKISKEETLIKEEKTDEVNLIDKASEVEDSKKITMIEELDIKIQKIPPVEASEELKVTDSTTTTADDRETIKQVKEEDKPDSASLLATEVGKTVLRESGDSSAPDEDKNNISGMSSKKDESKVVDSSKTAALEEASMDANETKKAEIISQEKEEDLNEKSSEKVKEAVTLLEETKLSSEIDLSELPPQQFKGEEIVDTSEIQVSPSLSKDTEKEKALKDKEAETSIEDGKVKQAEAIEISKVETIESSLVIDQSLKATKEGDSNLTSKLEKDEEIGRDSQEVKLSEIKPIDTKSTEENKPVDLNIKTSLENDTESGRKDAGRISPEIIKVEPKLTEQTSEKSTIEKSQKSESTIEINEEDASKMKDDDAIQELKKHSTDESSKPEITEKQIGDHVEDIVLAEGKGKSNEVDNVSDTLAESEKISKDVPVESVEKESKTDLSKTKSEIKKEETELKSKDEPLLESQQQGDLSSSQEKEEQPLKEETELVAKETPCESSVGLKTESLITETTHTIDSSKIPESITQQNVEIVDAEITKPSVSEQESVSEKHETESKETQSQEKGEDLLNVVTSTTIISPSQTDDKSETKDKEVLESSTSTDVSTSRVDTSLPGETSDKKELLTQKETAVQLDSAVASIIREDVKDSSSTSDVQTTAADILSKESKQTKTESHIEINSKIVSTDETKEVESSSISQLIESSELQSALFKDIKSLSSSIQDQESVLHKFSSDIVSSGKEGLKEIRDSLQQTSDSLIEKVKDSAQNIVETVTQISEKISEEVYEDTVAKTKKEVAELISETIYTKKGDETSKKQEILAEKLCQFEEELEKEMEKDISTTLTSKKEIEKTATTEETTTEKTEEKIIQESSKEAKQEKVMDEKKVSEKISSKTESVISESVTESNHSESSVSGVTVESCAKETTTSSIETQKKESTASEPVEKMGIDKDDAAEKKEMIKESNVITEKSSESPKEKSKKIEETIISDVTLVTKESEQFVVKLDFGMDAPETPRVEDTPEFKKLDSTTKEEVKHIVSDTRLPSALDTSCSSTDYNKETENEDRLKRIEQNAHETVIKQTDLVEHSSKEIVNVSLISDKEVSSTSDESTSRSKSPGDSVKSHASKDEKEEVLQKHETETLEKTIKESSGTSASEKDKNQVSSIQTITSSFLKEESCISAKQREQPEIESSTVRIISEKKEGKGEIGISSVIYEQKKDDPARSDPLGSGKVAEIEQISDISGGHASKSTTHWEVSEARQELEHFESDEEIPGSPMSIASHIPSPPNFDYELKSKESAMTSSFYGSLPDDPDKKDTFAAMYISKYEDDSEVDPKIFSPSKVGPFEAKVSSERRDSMNLNGTKEADKSLPETHGESSKDPIESWGKPLGLPPPPKSMKNYDDWNPIVEWGHPLGLPTPTLPTKENGDADLDLSNQSPTRRKIEKMNAENERIASNIYSGKETINKILKRSESPVKKAIKGDAKKGTPVSPIYLDLTYVPHHGNSHYADVEFFKKIRARYYVFSGTEPSKEVFNALLEAKQTWEDKDLEVTIIPTYDTDTLAYWVAENEETLTKNKIDLSPSASRCTINLQDHETSCSAYRLEF